MSKILDKSFGIEKDLIKMKPQNLQRYISDHYIFNYIADSIASSEIQAIAKEQEQCFLDITSFLGVAPSFKIKYYFLDTPELVGQLFGDNQPCNGFADFPDEIYAVYNKDIKCVGHHEDAHIISHIINEPNSSFIVEGLAMYFDKTWWGEPNAKWVKTFLQNDKYIHIRQLLDDEIFLSKSDKITYPIAGAFTKYLLETFGKKLYLEFYKYSGNQIADEIERIYKKNIDLLEKEFILSL